MTALSGPISRENTLERFADKQAFSEFEHDGNLFGFLYDAEVRCVNSERRKKPTCENLVYMGWVVVVRDRAKQSDRQYHCPQL